jgi:hypothetical protein
LILLSDLSKELVRIDLEGLSAILRGNYMYHHKTIAEMLKIYFSDKFKVSNKSLLKLREDYYVESTREKLKVSKTCLNLGYGNDLVNRRRNVHK